MATARVKLLELTLKNTGGKLIMTYFTVKRLNKTSSTRTEVHHEILGGCPMYQIVNIYLGSKTAKPLSFKVEGSLVLVFYLEKKSFGFHCLLT